MGVLYNAGYLNHALMSHCEKREGSIIVVDTKLVGIEPNARAAHGFSRSVREDRGMMESWIIPGEIVGRGDPQAS